MRRRHRVVLGVQVACVAWLTVDAITSVWASRRAMVADLKAFPGEVARQLRQWWVSDAGADASPPF
jgi:hypothetical protein